MSWAFRYVRRTSAATRHSRRTRSSVPQRPTLSSTPPVSKVSQFATDDPARSSSDSSKLGSVWPAWILSPRPGTTPPVLTTGRNGSLPNRQRSGGGVGENAMQHRPLGASGLLVSPVCLGTMTFGTPVGETESIRLIQAAIDLYIIHWPDREVPLETTLAAMDQAVRAGKVRHFGVSNHYGWQLCELLWLADRRGWPRVIASQIPFSLLRREFQDDLDFCRRHH